MSLIPLSLNDSMLYWMIGFPATGNMVLGFVSVNGLILEPSPALKIIAFTLIIPYKI